MPFVIKNTARVHRNVCCKIQQLIISSRTLTGGPTTTCRKRALYEECRPAWALDLPCSGFARRVCMHH